MHAVCVCVTAFIRKVYSILVCQLSVTVLFIALFLFVYVLSACQSHHHHFHHHFIQLYNRKYFYR